MPTLDQYRELAARLGALPPAARAAVRREFCTAYQCHAATLSRGLAEVGYRERSRSDRGVRRKSVSHDQLITIAAIQRASKSLRKGVIMPTADALEIARDSGVIDQDVSTSTVNRWLREAALSRDQQQQPTPHVELRSLGPNHVHQFDFSLAVNWKCFQGGLKYEYLVYKNKPPSAGEPRLWRGLLTDHASGSFAVHYVEATGETVQATLECLYHAWAAKPDSKRYPLRGLPRLLMLDRGSANQCKLTATMADRLGVTLNICEGARSKGSVEVSHRFWEDHFESRLRLDPPSSIEDLNRKALDYAVRLNGIPCHSRYGSPRSSMWSWHIGRREETQLRELRCNWEEFRSIALTEPHRALVSGNRMIRFRAQRYRLPEQAVTGSTVLVQYSPWDFPAILVRPADQQNAPAWLCEPVDLDEFGFPVEAPVIGRDFKGHKHTPAQVALKEADERLQQLLPTPKLRVFSHHADATPEVQHHARGEEVALPPVPDVRYTRMQARQLIVDRLGRTLTPPEASHVNAALSDSNTEAVVSSIIDQLIAGVSSRVLAFA